MENNACRSMASAFVLNLRPTKIALFARATSTAARTPGGENTYGRQEKQNPGHF